MNTLCAVRCASAGLLKFCNISTTSSAYAGHSHWQNVRHIKAAKDKEKSNKSQYFTQLLRRAVKEKQPSSRIKEIISNARAAQIPQSTLDRALNDTETSDPYVTAARASGGILILLESSCPRVQTERQRMSSVLKKYGFKLIDKETVAITRDFFDHSGFVVCEPNEKMSSLDEALEIGLEVGAEEVEAVKLTDSETVFQFQCSPRDVSQVAQSLKDLGANVLEYEDRYSPKELIQITQVSYKNMEEMYDRIRVNSDGVDRIFDNVEVS